MINLKYSMPKKELECKYIKTLYSTKFGHGKSAKSVRAKFEDLKKTYPYSVIFVDLSFSDIIFALPNNFDCLINTIESRIIEQSSIKYKTIDDKKKFSYETKDELKKVFKYEKKFQNPISKFFEDNLQTRTCYFCNIHFVNEYMINDTEYKNEFTLDHYYDKSSYPYLALSLYNLIPSCYTCNSKLKKTDTIKFAPPNDASFDFNERVKFKLYLDKSCKNLDVKSKNDIDIELKENYSNKYTQYIKVFKLNERYKAHKDIVFDMIEKAELYPESRLKELEGLTGIPFQQIRKDIFNLIDEDTDLSKEPFSKLIKDISEELKLI